ncbi:xanthine dehydrogenase family protein molybdopterin-binding subunit [Pendulispora albinea]|uniref:Xanthine dehydrogenase family protein molybdopterin-binding subunit n=1 Tax=Pendulispora albinea TaxID=2741071 RepID=A0ABZ2LSB0_9BACT
MSNVIGTNVPRTDGASKVTGAALYIDDYAAEGELYGATVRSSVPRGILRGIRKDPAFDWTGITVVTAEDIPGDNVVMLIEDDQPVLASKVIQHVYEPVALIACADPVRLQRAMKAITLDIEPLPPVLTMDEALAKEERIYRDDNVFKSYVIRHHVDDGDEQKNIDAILARCDVVLSGRYEVHHQEQLYIEPQGMIAWWDDAGVHVTGSLQCPYYVHKAMKRAFALEGEKVHVAQSVTGGGFGGKEEYPSVVAVHAALLARAAKRPVRLIYGRKEDIEATTKRHPARLEITTGCDEDGKLVALKFDCVMDGGAYATLTAVVLSRGVLHAAGAYEWKHARVAGRAVATNTPPNGAFRGFGAPQTIWGIERHMDRLAEKLGMDPLDLRKKNLLKIGSSTVTGQIIKESCGVEECIERAVQDSGYYEKRAAYAKDAGDAAAAQRRGIGVSVFMHGAGFTGSGERRLKGKVQIDLERGGKLRIRTASTDIGQGTETVFRQIAASAAGVPLDAIEFETPCTTNVPDSGPTVASRTVMVVGSIVSTAAKQIGDKVRAAGGAIADHAAFAAAGDRLLDSAKEPVTALVQYEPPVANQWDDDAYQGDAYPTYSWGCDIAEVEVDRDTFETKILGFWAAQDVGKAIHPVLCAGQVEGGTLQAIGWALYESVVWKNGHIMNPRMTNYVIPTSKDAPLFKTILVEHPFSGGPNGAKGVGELPMDGGAPAVAAAVEQAIDAHCNHLPLLPENLFTYSKNAGTSNIQ